MSKYLDQIPLKRDFLKSFLKILYAKKKSPWLSHAAKITLL